MTNDDLLGIGAFAVLTGLSVPALRHYHEVGILRPAVIDPLTGYRHYGPDQVSDARLICGLRAVDLPIEEIRDVLATRDDERTRAVLERHRARLAERSRTLARMVTRLEEYAERGVPMPEFTGCRVVEVNIGVDDLERSRRFYEEAFGVQIAEDRHGDGESHLQAVFGTWPSEEFFLLNIHGAGPGRAGRADFGFLVEDLDAAHERAVTAGADEVYGPRHVAGMPRCSGVRDPSGNRINLYQG